MAEYIDREVFKKSVEEYYCKPCKAEGKDYNGCRCRACWVDDMLDEIDCFQPAADAVEVVRCRECKHRGTDDCIFHIKGESADEELLLKLDNDFCSYGERKEGAD